MSYCRRCGKEIDEEARYCPNCGTETRGTHWEEVTVAADDLVGRVRQLIAEGNVRRIVVRNETGDLLLEIPVTAVAIGPGGAGSHRRDSYQGYYSHRA